MEYSYNARSDAFGSTFYCNKRKLIREPLFPRTTKNQVHITNIFRQQKKSAAIIAIHDNSPGKMSTSKKSVPGDAESVNIES